MASLSRCLFLFALTAVSGLSVSVSVDPQEVKAAVVLYRHGDRTPVDMYPTDPWKDPKYWPVGFGQLTDTGKRQHYQLGSRLRNRYQHLLNERYDPNELKVRSTDVDRAIQSALSNLAGLYPTSESNELAPGLQWQPVPVHTMPEAIDEVLAMKAPCPKLKLERERLLQTPYFQKLDEEYRPIYRYVSNHTGTVVDDMVSLSYIYDTLMIEELYNYTLPEWTKEVYPDKMIPITEMSFMIDTFTPVMARLKVGPLLREITENLVAAAKQESPHKIWVYSAHDTTIASFLNALSLKSYFRPPYASHVLVELLLDNSIRVTYQDDILEIPKCGNKCPLYQWVTNYAHLFPRNHTEDCHVTATPIVTPDTIPVLYSLVVIIILLILVNASIFIIMRRSFMVVQFK